MLETDRITTPLSKAQALAALEAAWGPGLSREVARGLLSLAWIETNRGNLQNYNPGNLTAGPSYAGKIWRPPWYYEPAEGASQRTVDLHTAMLRGKAPSAFRAYDSAKAGFADWVNSLKRTFPEVVTAATHATPDGFREALSQKYSGDYKNKQSTVTFQKLFIEWQPLVAHLPSAHRAGHWLAVVSAAGLAYGAWRWWRKLKGAV